MTEKYVCVMCGKEMPGYNGLAHHIGCLQAEVERLRSKLNLIRSLAKKSQQIGACEVCAEMEAMVDYLEENKM